MIIIICYITKFERTSMGWWVILMISDHLNIEPFDLSTRETLNGLGAIDADTMLATSGGRSPSGTFKSNCCNKLVRNRNTSILVNISPRHIRRPIRIINKTFKVNLN